MREQHVGNRPVRTLVVATSGCALLYLTWTLIGPVALELGRRNGLTPGVWALLGIVPVMVGVLVRAPAGMLADRLGARLVLPAVSVVAAGAVLALATVDAAASLVVVACAIGIAGGAFPAGAGAIIRAFPPGRRGVALSVFAAGMTLASATGIASRVLLDAQTRHGLPVLAAVLLAHALIALTMLRDGPAPAPVAGPTPRALFRLPATRHLAIWYGIAGGGMVAIDLILPSYLATVHGLSRNAAVLGTAAAVGLSATACTLGGWLGRRRDPTAVLRACYAVVAPLLLLLAFHPPLVWAAAPALAGVAAGVGTAFGTVLTLAGRVAPVRHAGAVVGAITAGGTAIALLPALLVTAVYGIDGSYTIALVLLAGGAVASASNLHARRGWLGATLAFPAQPVGSPDAATTVVWLSARGLRPHLGDAVAALATLATRHELVVVYDDPDASAGYGLVTNLRRRLPAHTVLAVGAGTPAHPHECAAVADMLEAGAVPVVLVTGTEAARAAQQLAEHVRADQLLRLTLDRRDGLVADATVPAAPLPQPLHR